eukprot:6682032-Pyramimonas_sp.AAC.1
MGNVLGLCKVDAYILLLILAVATPPDQVTTAGTERRHPQMGVEANCHAPTDHGPVGPEAFHADHGPDVPG